MAHMQTSDSSAIDIGSRLELLVDDYLIEGMTGAVLTLHQPAPQEVAIVHDQPWEGNTSYYHTVFRDGDLMRMYYRGSHADEQDSAPGHEFVCYAESRDGKVWTRPDLGLVSFQGSMHNNIIWDAEGAHDMTPFRDLNPESEPKAAYKALARRGKALYALQSPDAIHWSLMSDKPVITKGAFDSQNLAFWDTLRGCYVDYHREFRLVNGERVRDIMTCTSHDFLHWSDPVFISYAGAPDEHLYTNQIQPYYRAPHIYMGFPKRFMPKRTTAHDRFSGISDVVFMSSRDGLHFRRWGEAWIRPGPPKERWVNRNNFVAWGMVETESPWPGTPKELSFFSMEGYYRGESCQMRRYTLRVDGFVSARAPLAGGEVETKSLRFAGSRLNLNFATSAAGSVRVEIGEIDGTPVPGFRLSECDEMYGDDLARAVTWGGKADVGQLAGRPLRLRFVLRDADLYAFQFADAQ
jgi:hypothetical protein